MTITADSFQTKDNKNNYCKQEFYPNGNIKRFVHTKLVNGNMIKLYETTYYDNRNPHIEASYNDDGTPSRVTIYNENGTQNYIYSYDGRYGLTPSGTVKLNDSGKWVKEKKFKD